MLFINNAQFLDRCADVIMRFLGKTSPEEPLGAGALKTFSTCGNMGWEAEANSVRCVNGLTMREIFASFPESAILWETLVELPVDVKAAPAEAEDGQSDVGKTPENCFGSFVYPTVCELGKRNGRVSVTELVSKMAAYRGKPGKDELMKELPLAEDVAYIWIKVIGFDPDCDRAESDVDTAARMKGGADGADALNYVMEHWSMTIDYARRVPVAIKWLDDNCSSPDTEVTFEAYMANVVTVPDSFLAELLHECKGFKGLYHLCKEVHEGINTREYGYRVRVLENNTARLSRMLKDAVDGAKSAVATVVDEASHGQASARIAELEQAYGVAEQFWILVANMARTQECVKNFVSVLEAARREKDDCRRMLEVAVADMLARRDKERQEARGRELLDEINAIGTYINDFEKGYLLYPNCKSVIRKAVRELKGRMNALRALHERAKTAEYGDDFYNSAGVRDIYEGMVQRADELMRKALELMDDPDVPENVDLTLIDRDKWIYDLGDGARAQFVLIDEDGDGGEEGDAPGMEFAEFSKYHRLTDSAIAVKRQPVFGDYPDKNTYPYFRPFQFQLESVRTMLAKFEGRGIFGDQVGLGKTIETLMTADVMFRCGAISNAVIVVREANVHQWRKEISVKFRKADGSPMFRLLPESGSGRAFFTVDEIPAVTTDDSFARRENDLKIYFLSSDSLQSVGFAARMEEISRMRDEYAVLCESTEEIPLASLADYDRMIEQATNTDVLYLIKKAIYDQLLVAVKADSRIADLEYMGKIYGFEEFDPRKDRAVIEKEEFRGKGYFFDLDSYNGRIMAAALRMEELIARKNEISKALDGFRMGAIGLLIFDEVQDIVDKLNSEYSDRSSATALRDFIADIDKKYCILLSATPIKNDISDLFQLVYMIDKKRLGATRQEAEDSFYRVYCGGYRTLSEIAAAPDRDVRFRMLNELINSIFTRKRIYDADVLDSMKRQCATPEEKAEAQALGRDDYGGERFEALMRVLSLAFDCETIEPLEKRIERRARIESYSVQVCGGFGMTSDEFLTAITDMSKCITNATAEEALTDGGVLEAFDICGAFLANKQKLTEAENAGDTRGVERYRSHCDRSIGCINKGLIQYYCREDLSYSPVFIADCLDWTRPRKRGVRIDGIDSAARKVDVFARALGGKDESVDCVGMTADDVRELRRGKVVFYDRVAKNRVDLYRAMKAASAGSQRRVYLNLTDGDVEREGLGMDDLIYLNYYGSSGSAGTMSEMALAKINGTSISNRTPEEMLYLETYGEGIPECSHSDINFRNFTEFSAENGNWNAVCLIDRAHTVGTDLDAANVLCIGQLDDGNGEYLDPLDLERLIGRISHLGQTEECLIYTCLYNGSEDGAQLDRDFNAAYYDVLTDPEGFDLFGAGMTELAFALPVVMACLKHLLNKGDAHDFTATLSTGLAPLDPSENNFADVFRYVYDNRDKIRVTVKEDGAEKEVDAIEGVKRLIRKYVSLVSAAYDGGKQ